VSQRTNRSKSTDDSEFSFVGTVCFLAVVALFIFVSTKAGTRGVGACMAAGALSQIRKRRFAYGRDGRPPSGYITGWPATLLSLVFTALGVAVLIWPDVAMRVFGWD